MDSRVLRRSNLKSKRRRKSCGQSKGQCGSSPVEFDSESLSSSSPLKPDVAVKKTRRKKIRSTQDFNHLDSSLSSQDSDMSNKSEKHPASIIRKHNGVHFLPKITNLSEDMFNTGKENVSPNLFTASIKTPTISTRFRLLKKTSKKSNDISTAISRNVKKTTKYLKDNKKQVSEDSEGSSEEDSNFIDSEDAENSEIEIKQKNKKRDEVLMDVENKSSGDHVRRLKRLLASNSAPTSEEKTAKNSTGSKKRGSIIKTSKRRTTRELRNRSKSNDFIQTVEKHDSDNEFDLGTEDSTERKQVRKSVRFAEVSIENNIRRNTFDIDKCSESISLFNKMSSKTPDDISEITENIPIINRDKSLSDSGESNKLNHTFEITSPKYMSLSMKEMENDYLPSPIRSLSLRSSLKTKVTDANTTKPDISSNVATPKPYASAKLINNDESSLWKYKSHITVRESSIIDLRTPLGQKLNDSSSYKNSESKKLQKAYSFTRSTNGSTRLDKSLINGKELYESSVKDATSNVSFTKSPIPFSKHSTNNVNNTIHGELYVSPIKDAASKTSFTKSPIPLNKHSTKSVNVTNTNNDDELYESSIKDAARNVSFTKSPTTLDKHSTHNVNVTNTIDDDENHRNSLIDINFFSPIQGKSPVVNLMDTSRVTKRKQWDKSRISMSFLDNSIDINNVSAPWANDSLNTTFGVSKFNDSRILSNLGMSVKRNREYEMPPSNSSTPLPKPKNYLSKQVSFKEKNVSVSKTKNSSKLSNKQSIKMRTKMPNFSLIHQRAYDKLENLKEMSERKALRAKLLLSGCKPDAPVSTNACGKSQKILQFSPARPKIPTATKKIEKIGKEIVLNSSKVSVTKIKYISPSKSNPKVATLVNKFNKLPPVEKKKELHKPIPSRIPTKVSNNVTAEKKGFTRYGFKLGAKEVTATKEEQVKAIVSKTKVVKNTVDERRKAVQGVRSNRRFELLMNMRKK